MPLPKHILVLTALAFSITLSTKAQNNDCADCSCFANHSLTWHVETDKKGREYLVRGDSLKQKHLGLNHIISSFNATRKVTIKLVKTENKTVYVKILNNTYLQQMGLAGVQWYLACLTYTLTETPAHNRIYIDLEEGDHTGPPSFYNRNAFKRQFIICE